VRYLSRIIILSALLFNINLNLNATDSCSSCSSCGAYVSLDDCTLNECTTFRDGIAAWIGSTTSNFPGDTGSSSGGGGSDAAAVTKFIRQADLVPHYVICCPGTYVLSEPLELISPSAGTSLIYIASSDVTLDLNGYALYYDGSTGVSGLNGVRLCPGVRNVKVLNGSIRKFTNAGILADATSSDSNCTGCSTSGCDITDVKIQDLVLSNNKNGTHFIGSTSCKVYNIAANCITASGNSNNGLFFNGVTCSSIMKSNFTKNVAVGTTVAGIKCTDCKVLLIKSNNADCNESNQNAYGIYLNNSATGTPANSCGNVIASNSTDLNKSTGSSSSYQAAGINVEASQNCQVIKNRSAYNTAASITNGSYGILLNATISTTKQCEVTCNEVIENQVGIQDTNSTSLFRKNISYRNLPNSATQTDNGGPGSSTDGNDGAYRNFNIDFVTSGSGTSDFSPLYKRVTLQTFSEISTIVQNTWLNISVVH
jgi:hypothetical protein